MWFLLFLLTSSVDWCVHVKFSHFDLKHISFFSYSIALSRFFPTSTFVSFCASAAQFVYRNSRCMHAHMYGWVRINFEYAWVSIMATSSCTHYGWILWCTTRCERGIAAGVGIIRYMFVMFSCRCMLLAVCCTFFNQRIRINNYRPLSKLACFS